MTYDGSSVVELGINDPESPDQQDLWIDLTEEGLEDDPKYQAYLAYMDQDEFQFVATTPETTQELGVGAFQRQFNDLNWTGFLQVRKYWQTAIISFLRKTRHFGRHKISGVPWCNIDTCWHEDLGYIYLIFFTENHLRGASSKFSTLYAPKAKSADI